jgi:hypothetical protein
VVISPHPDSEDEKAAFRLGDGPLHLSPEYKYLGVDMGKLGDTGRNTHIKRVVRKATMSMHQLAYSVSGRSPLHISTSVYLFKTLVRPVLEYASGIWSCMCTQKSRKLLERVQVHFGRRVLHLQQSIPGTYVRTELGLESFEERGVAATLRYFGKLCCMDRERLAATLFRMRCNSVDDDQGGGTFSWCYAAKASLVRCGLRAAWTRRTVDAEKWPGTVRDAVHNVFQQEDTERIQKRPQLALFGRLGPATSKEWLDRPLNHQGAALRFRLRCGGAPLMETVGAKSNDQLCRMCANGAVEDAQHFAGQCSFYDAQREECLRRVAVMAADANAPGLRQAIATRDVALFLGDSKLSELPPRLRRAVDVVICNYLMVAWRRRAAVWRQLTVDGNQWRLR